jgi:hypothetical protein
VDVVSKTSDFNADFAWCLMICAYQQAFRASHASNATYCVTMGVALSAFE